MHEPHFYMLMDLSIFSFNATIPSWKQMMPPPLPPRDDPLQVQSPLRSPVRTMTFSDVSPN